MYARVRPPRPPRPGRPPGQARPTRFHLVDQGATQVLVDHGGGLCLAVPGGAPSPGLVHPRTAVASPPRRDATRSESEEPEQLEEQGVNSK